MKDNKHSSTGFPGEDDTQKAAADTPQDGVQHKAEKLKKPLIFALMGVVFLGCMYLIFTPSSDGEGLEDIGLNPIVPQATGTGLQADKQKAYQQPALTGRLGNANPLQRRQKEHQAHRRKELRHTVFAQGHLCP